MEMCSEVQGLIILVTVRNGDPYEQRTNGPESTLAVRLAANPLLFSPTYDIVNIITPEEVRDNRQLSIF